MPKYTPLGILIYLAIFLFPLQLHAYDDTYYKENVEVFDNHVLPRIRSKLTPSERSIKLISKSLIIRVSRTSPSQRMPRQKYIFP